MVIHEQASEATATFRPNDFKFRPVEVMTNEIKQNAKSFRKTNQRIQLGKQNISSQLLHSYPDSTQLRLG